MIDFSGVRRESEPTCLFFARSLRMALEHALKERQATGWRIMTSEKAARHFPEAGLFIGDSVLAFVSHCNREDMSRKSLEVERDPDIIDWLNAGCERLIRDCQLEAPFQ